MHDQNRQIYTQDITQKPGPAMSDSNSNLIPRDERQFETSLKVHVPGAALDISYRRMWDNRADRFANDTATAAGMTLDDVAERISDGGPIANIYVTAGQKAWERGDPYLNDILARLVAAALLDDARIDTTAYIIDRIVKLEPIHMRIVDLFLKCANEEDTINQAGQDPSKKYEHLVDCALENNSRHFHLREDKLGPILSLDVGIVRSCLQDLKSVGFTHTPYSEDRYQITALGLAASKIINDVREQLAGRVGHNADDAEAPTTTP